MRPRFALLLLSAAAVVLGGCGSDAGSAGDGRLDVVVTTTQLADVARAVGGDAAEVDQLLRPNTDPHEYEPRPDDVRETAAAAVVLTSGDGLDAWMADVLEQSGSDARVVDLGAVVPERRPGEAAGREASRYDPHWWHDPRNVVAATRAIRDAMTAARPAQAAVFERNARTYERKLAALDAGIAACIGRVPRAQRKLVTDHDAFGYFAARYGVDVVGAVIPSQTSEAQPSARSVATLAATIRAEGVRAVFPEEAVNAKLAEAIARASGADATLRLFGDTLGPEGSRGATYLAMEQANAAAMVDGFTGSRRGCPIPALRLPSP